MNTETLSAVVDRVLADPFLIALPVAAVLLVSIAAAAWRVSWRYFYDDEMPRPDGMARLLFGLGALAIPLLASPAVWMSAVAAYPGDSFHTLNLPAQIGLAALTALMLLLGFQLTLAKSIRLAGSRTPAGRLFVGILDVGGTAAAFILLWGLSPQLYYEYYKQVIPNLPSQLVIRDPFPVFEVLERAMLRADGSIADHLTGLAFLSICLAALAPHLMASQRRIGISTSGWPPPWGLALTGAILTTAAQLNGLLGPFV